jgi:hypothetical protein
MQLIIKKEIAARYRVSVRTIDNWTGTILPSLKINGKRLYDVEECDKAIRAFAQVPRLAKRLAAQ